MFSRERKLILFGFVLLINRLDFARGQTFQEVTDRCLEELQWNWQDPILYWNYVAIESCACDYSPSMVRAPDQDGPTRNSRALAIIHGVMFDAYNYVYQAWRMIFPIPFESIQLIQADSRETVAIVAITQGAYRCFVSLFPQQKPIYDKLKDDYMRILQDRANRPEDIETGKKIGDLIATTVLNERAKDRSNATVNMTIPSAPGFHEPDPTRPTQKLHNPHWGRVKPFILQSGSQFRTPNIFGRTPQERLQFLTSPLFIRDYIEVFLIGARETPWRTDDQTEIANFWAYDGSKDLGVPPRLYNKVARTIAIQMGNSMADNALLFALVNYALADACICSWDTKYVYNFWRPIVAIRKGSPLFKPQPNWTPLGIPTNGVGNPFTPGFPSMNSGHSAFGSALFQVLRRFYKRDDISFTLASDEYNGKTYDSATNSTRPQRVRYYDSFVKAEIENELARIYLGVHWRIDQSDGREMGRRVADYICDQILPSNTRFCC